MASTYTLISSQVLASSAASVTFSSIPATYTDLVLRCSMKNTNTGGTSPIGGSLILNGDSASVLYSWTYIYGTGASAGSSRLSGTAPFSSLQMNGSNAGFTTNTFTFTEFYIPNYTSTVAKPISLSNVVENNTATTFVEIDADAILYSNTSAITSIALNSGVNTFAANSSFYLYGISNA